MIRKEQASFNKAIAVLNVVKLWLFDQNPDHVVNLGIQCNGMQGNVLYDLCICLYYQLKTINVRIMNIKFHQRWNHPIITRDLNNFCIPTSM